VVTRSTGAGRPGIFLKSRIKGGRRRIGIAVTIKSRFCIKVFLSSKDFNFLLVRIGSYPAGGCSRYRVQTQIQDLVKALYCIFANYKAYTKAFFPLRLAYLLPAKTIDMARTMQSHGGSEDSIISCINIRKAVPPTNKSETPVDVIRYLCLITPMHCTPFA
jgi:hypothetical protein